MPVFHEIVANALVFGRERGKLFGPLAHIDTPLSQKRDWNRKFNPPRCLRTGEGLISKPCSLHAQATLPFSLKGSFDFLKTIQPEKKQ
jgi:hypothetical protein